MEMLTSAIIIVLGVPCVILLFFIGLKTVEMIFGFLFSPFQEIYNQRRRARRAEFEAQINTYKAEQESVSELINPELSALIESVRGLDMETVEKIRIILKKIDIGFFDKKMENEVSTKLLTLAQERTIPVVTEKINDEQFSKFIELCNQAKRNESFNYLLSTYPKTEAILWKDIFEVVYEFESEFKKINTDDSINQSFNNHL